MRRGEVVKTVRGIPKTDPVIIVHPVPIGIPFDIPVPEREKVSVPIRKEEEVRSK